METRINQMYAYIQRHQLIPADSRVLVGLSGGPDSIFLLYALYSLRKDMNISLYVAHVDHEWRTDSHQDMQFCKRIADDLQIPFFHARASEISIDKAPRGSWEAYARYLRRSYFSHLQKEHGIDRIALAHHKDDQRETFFIRLLRGSGLTGLTSIRPRRGDYIHPLLNLTKQEICSALDEQGITYLSDPTNASQAMLRNRIRTHLMPALEQCDSRAHASLDRTITRLQEADDYLHQHIVAEYFACLDAHRDVHNLHIPTLLDKHPYMRRQIILHWLIAHDVPFTPTTGLFYEIERFLANVKSSKHTIHPRWHIMKENGYARIV